MTDTTTEEIQKQTAKCPICGKEQDAKYHPFCSKKCADIDLGRWLKGSYVIHTNEVPEESDLADLLTGEKAE